jgi:hypothetical protein
MRAADYTSWMRALLAASIVSVSLTALGCGGITTPSSNTTDTFNGTLPPKDSRTHQFTVSKTGEFTVKLTAWTPNSNIFVGLALTQGAGDGSCGATFQQNVFVSLNTQALGGPIVSGRYCVVIFDVGSMTAAQNYTITVSHPS